MLFSAPSAVDLLCILLANPNSKVKGGGVLSWRFFRSNRPTREKRHKFQSASFKDLFPQFGLLISVPLILKEAWMLQL